MRRGIVALEVLKINTSRFVYSQYPVSRYIETRKHVSRAFSRPSGKLFSFAAMRNT